MPRLDGFAFDDPPRNLWLMTSVDSNHGQGDGRGNRESADAHHPPPQSQAAGQTGPSEAGRWRWVLVLVWLVASLVAERVRQPK
jgi:hypothetical protein